MGKTFGWHSLLVVLVAACGGDKVTAPGVCPAFCTGVTALASDTLLRTSVRGDSTYSGYVPPHRATQLVVASPGGLVESRAVMRFFRFADTIPLNAGDTTTRAVTQTDSFQVAIVVGRRTANVADLRLALYRLPSTVDSTTTYADLAPFFDDSTFITEFPVPANGSYDSLVIGFLPSRLPTFAADTLRAAIGVALRASSPSFVALAATEAGRGSVMSRFVRVDSVVGTSVARVVALGTQLDTYIFPPLVPPGPGILSVGGSPSARTFARLDIPRRIVDSADVIRGTLLLIPASPVVAAPGDTLVVYAHAVSSDIGPKSPVQPVIADSTGISGGRIVAGQNDTIRIDITYLLRAWHGDTLSTHSLVLRMNPEGGSFGEIRFWSTADPTRRPLLEVTYVPPLSYQGR